MGVKKGFILILIAWLANTLVCFHGVDPFKHNVTVSGQGIVNRHAPQCLLSWLVSFRQRATEAQDTAQSKIKYQYRYLTKQVSQLKTFWKKLDAVRQVASTVLMCPVRPASLTLFALVKASALPLFRLTPF